MDTDVYYLLSEIKNKFRERIFGQICQDLLALALEPFFHENIEVRNIEGVDIIINDEKQKYAIEVKTTSGGTINLAVKDCEGLKKFQAQGYEPILAALKWEMGAEWIFYDAQRLKPKSNLAVNGLYTADKYKKMAAAVQQHFEEEVKANYSGILTEGLEYLTNKLKEKNLKYSG